MLYGSGAERSGVRSRGGCVRRVRGRTNGNRSLTDPHTDANQDAVLSRQCHADKDEHAGADLHADAHSHADRHADVESHTDCDGDANLRPAPR